jgi:acyl dehydratase
MRSFDEVRAGEPIPELTRVISREDVRAYAEASGDRNPLHLDDEVARAAGFDRSIAHGMLTMGHLASALVAWAGDAGAIARMRVQFRAPVLVDETVVAGGTIRALDPDRRIATVDVWVKVRRDGAEEWPIRRSEAEIRLA